MINSSMSKPRDFAVAYRLAPSINNAIFSICADMIYLLTVSHDETGAIAMDLIAGA